MHELGWICVVWMSDRNRLKERLYPYCILGLNLSWISAVKCKVGIFLPWLMAKMIKTFTDDEAL